MRNILKIILTLLIGGAFATSGYAAKLYHPETGEKLAADQTFTYWALDEHSSIDPQIVEDVSGSDIIRDLFEGLLNQDADGNLVPGVAESWSANDAKDVYTFNLRKNAKWSNGDTVTAHDFVYAWQRAVDPATASPYSWFMDIMSIKNGGAAINGDVPPSDLGVKALDDFTFQVELTASLPYFAAMTTHATTFPTHKGTIEKYGSDWTKPGNMVSNGAYVLTEHVINERLVRERNSKYWNNSDTILEKVVALVIPDEDQGLIRYQAGELDKGPVPSGQFKKLKKEYPDQAVSFPRLCNYYYTFNLSDSGIEAFQDVRVRHAMSYAIDRNVITEDILQAGQIPAYTFTPGATAGFEVPGVAFSKMTQAERDTKAVELMERALDQKDLNTWAKADDNFHRSILGLCPNRRLAQFVSQLLDQAHRVRMFTLFLREIPYKSTQEHWELIQDLQAGDTLSVQRNHRVHREKASRELINILERHQLKRI